MILMLGIVGAIVYFMTRGTPLSSVVDEGYTAQVPAPKPFDVLSVNPVITPGTVGGYQPPVFQNPVIAPPSGVSGIGTHAVRRVA
jgi:hypothetical protein